MNYFYIFDPRGDRESKYFERMQGGFTNLLTEMRLEGENYRVTSIRTIDLLVEQALGANAKTLVVVGSDASLNKAINAVVRQGSDLTLGYIPLNPDSALAHIFGIPIEMEAAVKTLAARLARNLDLGSVAENYFLTKVDLGGNEFTRIEPGFMGLGAARNLMRLDPFQVSVSIDGNFVATSEVLGMQVINSRSNERCLRSVGDPTDGLLDVILLKKMSGTERFRYRRELSSGCLDNVPGATLIHAKKVEVLGPKKLPLSVDGAVFAKAPATITLAKEKIKIIMGKGRRF